MNRRLLAFLTMLALTAGTPAAVPAAPPATPDSQASAPRTTAVISSPETAGKPQRMNLIFRVVRVILFPDGKPVGEPQVVDTKTEGIYRNALSDIHTPAGRIRYSTRTKDGRVLPLEVRETLTQASAALISDAYAFRIVYSPHIQKDDSVLLDTTVRIHGAAATGSTWPQKHTFEAVRHSAQRLVPGQTPVRIAEAKAWADTQEWQPLLRRKRTARESEAATVYYLEVSVEPASLDSPGGR